MTYGYDAVGRLLSAANGTDSLGWSYDLAGQKLSETSTQNGSALTYGYDLGGNRLSVSLDGSIVLTYAYDDAGRLTTITHGSSVFGFGYDDASRRTSLSYPSGVGTSYAYDVVSRLTDVAAGIQGGPILTESTYTYDAAGNRLTKGGDFAESYTYGGLSRLIQVRRGETTTEQYTYDAVGNRTTSLSTPGITWTYDDGNRLQSVDTTTFTYDSNGNLTQKIEGADTWTYEWDAENRLNRVLKNSVEQARFAYDPLGRRVEKVVGSTTHTWLYDGDDIVQESDGATTYNFLHGPGIDEPLARRSSDGQVLYGHADGLGSVTTVTNSLGQVSFTRRYDAFGNIEVGANQGSYAFTGREWDPETGLYYYRARYYDPKIGRFISEDPIGFGGGINFYAYVLNNPVNATDPSGLDLNICHRQTHGVPNRVRTPHAVVFSTKTGRGHGFGAREGEIPLPGVPVPGQIFPEDPYDPNGKPKPGYECSTRTTNSCIEDCYNEELPFQQAAPPNYKIAPRWMGGNVCTDWPQDMITRCTLKCAGKL